MANVSLTDWKVHDIVIYQEEVQPESSFVLLIKVRVHAFLSPCQAINIAQSIVINYAVNTV